MCEKEISCKRLTVMALIQNSYKRKTVHSSYLLHLTQQQTFHFILLSFTLYLSLPSSYRSYSASIWLYSALHPPSSKSLPPPVFPWAHRRQGDVIPPLPGDVGNCTLCALGHGRVCVCVWVYVWKCVWVASRLSFWMRDTNGKKRRRETVVGWLWNLFQ